MEASFHGVTDFEPGPAGEAPGELAPAIRNHVLPALEAPGLVN
jgi:hypothetical protein